MGILQFYLGFKGKNAQFASFAPLFWSAFGMIFGIIIGSLSGAWAGFKTVSYAVKVNYWTYGGAGHSFYYNTEGDTILGSWMGFFESGWVVAFMAVAVALVVMPYLLAMELQGYVTKVASDPSIL